MKIRLIKPGKLRSNDRGEQPPVKIPIIDTVRGWVREFQSKRANRDRLDLERLSNSGKR